MILKGRFRGNLPVSSEVSLERFKRVLKTCSIILIFSLTSVLSAQSVIKIDYWGVVASEVDANMYKMTSDLYYTQLCEIPLFSVTDKRSDKQLTAAPSQDNFSPNTLSFYAVIEKEGDSKWISTFYVINKGTSNKKAQSKEYDSYYKILTEPKAVLQDSIKTLITSNQSQAVTKAENPTTDSQTTGSTTEMLSGTWDGEDVIDKIVIMRGGRGFVVFKNGASMNVIIKFDDFDSSKILVIQSAKSNASFFPDLPRQVALREAVNASPIQWTFSLKDNNTLSGTKKTLLSDGEENAKEGTVEVTWKRRS